MGAGIAGVARGVGGVRGAAGDTPTIGVSHQQLKL